MSQTQIEGVVGCHRFCLSRFLYSSICLLVYPSQWSVSLQLETTSVTTNTCTKIQDIAASWLPNKTMSSQLPRYMMHAIMASEEDEGKTLEMNPKTDRHPSCSLVHKAHSKTKVFGFFGSQLPAVSFCLLSICQTQELWRRYCWACLSIHCARQTAQTGPLSPYFCTTRTGHRYYRVSLSDVWKCTLNTVCNLNSLLDHVFKMRKEQPINIKRWEQTQVSIESTSSRRHTRDHPSYREHRLVRLPIFVDAPECWSSDGFMHLNAEAQMVFFGIWQNMAHQPGERGESDWSPTGSFNKPGDHAHYLRKLYRYRDSKWRQVHDQLSILHRRSLPNIARLRIINVGSCPFVQVMMTLLLLFVTKQLCLIIQSCWTQLFMMLYSAILIKAIIYHFIDSKCVWKQGMFSRCHSLSVELFLVTC